jgi:hypothetical protein
MMPPHEKPRGPHLQHTLHLIHVGRARIKFERRLTQLGYLRVREHRDASPDLVS